MRETKLPGVGVRYEFTSDQGQNVGVIVHHDGRREILAYDVDDPDACRSLLTLSDADTHVMAELLGTSNVTETVAEIRHEIEGLAIEWVPLSESSSFNGHSIGEGGFRTRTGASIVAAMRNNEAIPAPGPEFVLQAGDVIVAVGTHEGLQLLRTLLEE